MVRLIAGEYTVIKSNEKGELFEEILEWWECKEHYHGGLKRGGLCSAGPLFMDRKNREDCYGCDIFWEGKDPNGKRKISMSDKFVFATVDQGLFHHVPQVDFKTQQYRMNEKTGKPYMEWAKCTRQGCTHCNTAEESKYGQIKPWPLSKTHFNTLNGYAEGIGTCCVTCSSRGVDSRGVIETAMWQCSNSECGEMIFDMSNTTATIEQIKDVVNDPYTCRACGQTQYPEAVIQCKNCTPAGLEPVRATIFDVDMQVRVQKTGDGDQTALIIEGTSDPQAMDPQFDELLQYKPNLEKRFSPTTLQKQADLWGISHTPAGAPQGGHTQQYGQQ
jgi:hypothetical protein